MTNFVVVIFSYFRPKLFFYFVCIRETFADIDFCSIHMYMIYIFLLPPVSFKLCWQIIFRFTSENKAKLLNYVHSFREFYHTKSPVR